VTKYVLNSGGLRNQPERAKKFFVEITKDLGPKPNFLMCYFAEKREDWEKKFSDYTIGFSDLMPEGVDPDYKLAIPNEFPAQVAWSDILYMHGGDDSLIRFWLQKFDLPKIWDGKVVATNSASSDVLSKHFWPCDWRECMDGLGILDIKFLPHYKSNYGSDSPRGPINWEQAKNELEEYGDKSLPVYALEEGEFVVIEQ
jgi:hypothetical protein